MRTAIIRVLTVLCMLSAPALACWSGHQVRLQGVRLLGSDTQLDPAQIRQYAIWLPRIAAITPVGVVIDTDDTPSQSAFAEPGWCTGEGEAFACDPLKWDATLPSLFEAVRVRGKASAQAASPYPT